MSAPALAVVLPVYNEEAAIEGVVRSWTTELDALGIDFEIHAYDDGSRDGSAELLRTIARSNARLRVHLQENAGHGPTVLRGYRDNAASEWIFQVDSDDEMEARHFAALWRERDACDLVVGERAAREQAWDRRIVSAASRLTVYALFGSQLRDVNSPYRLMRARSFRGLFGALPSDTFAPNLILSGMASRLGLRVRCVPVPHRPRQTGSVSLSDGRLLGAACRSFQQTLRARFALRSLSGAHAPGSASALGPQ